MRRTPRISPLAVSPWLPAVTIACAASLLVGCGSGAAFRLPDPRVRYVAFGDSTTAGPAERDYGDFLIELLGIDATAFAIEGESEERIDDGVQRLRGLIAGGIYPNANTLLFWEGAKDLMDFIKDRDPLLLRDPNDENYPFTQQLEAKLDQIQDSLETAIRTAKEAGLDVYVATYFFLPRGSLNCDPLVLDVLLPGEADRANVYVARLNERIRQGAANEGATVVDVAALDDVLRDTPLNYHDCTHLSASGNAIVAEAFGQAIRGE